MTQIIKNVTVGADPEVFLRDIITGEFISAEGKIGGTKENPKEINKKGYFVQEDNIMAEFCIPPCKNADEFFHANNYMLNYLRANTATEVDIAIFSAAVFHDKYLKTKQAQTFGCDPDFDVYTQLTNQSPSAENFNLRTAGGHIHIGYENPTDEISFEIIKALDLYIGVPSVIMEADSRRREMYGKAGAFRLKSYGVEYRTPSNFWLKDEEHIRWAFNNTMLAIDMLNKGGKVENGLASDIIDAINYNDVDSAAEIIGAFKIPFIENKLVVINNKEQVVASKNKLVNA